MRLKYYSDAVAPSWWTPFSEEVLPVLRRDPLCCQLEHFLEVIQGKSEPLVSAMDGLRNLQVSEAIYESAQKSKIVYL